MLVKWVSCTVSEAAAFDRGQRAWSALHAIPGFVGQGGGWDVQRAHVFGFWADRASYDRFMAVSHDTLAAGQAGTYSGIEVRLFEHRLDMAAPFDPDFSDAGLIRLAHCQVRPGRTEHFERAQAEVWNPGMSRTPGMLRGLFAEGPSGYLVLSLWRSAADHEHYRRERLPDLRARAGAADDLAGITGHVIEIEPAWSVRAS